MATLAACCACQGATCLSNAACSCFGSATNRSSKLARLAYTTIFFTVSLMSWMWYAWGYDWYIEKFPHSIIHVNCPEETCFGAMSVYRVTSVLTIFYLIHSLIAVLCHGAKINAKWWGLKLILLLGSMIVTFILPNPIFYVLAWIELIGATVFIILQLILLVEFAHSWSESWVKKWDEDPENIRWFYGLLISSLSLYVLTLAFTITEYIIFTQDQGCGINALNISINVVLILIGTGLSLHPKVQEKNPNSGLLQSATVASYTAYLIWSALMSQPEGICNHINDGKQSVSAITGAIIVFISVCYSAFRVSNKSDILMTSQTTTTSILSADHQRIDSDPGSQLESGPASNQQDEDREEEKGFNYAFFHICFALASCYMAMLITNWMIVKKADLPDNSHYVIDRSIGSMWVKIATSWLAHLLYIWSLVAPVLLPNRIFYEL